MDLYITSPSIFLSPFTYSFNSLYTFADIYSFYDRPFDIPPCQTPSKNDQTLV
ncbi:rCG60341, partial [Rattus norvegicus]